MQASGPNNPEEHFGDEKPARNPQRQRKHLLVHAGGVAVLLGDGDGDGDLEIIALMKRLQWRNVQKMLDEATEPWGIKVERVEM